MKQFFITNPSYNGSAKITYDATGKLVQIDVMETDMKPEHIHFLKLKIPTNELELRDAFAEKPATVIIEKGVEVSFEQFWEKYALKVNRKRCEPLWAKLKSEERVLAYIGINKYNKYLRDTGYRGKADPEKYLKLKYWENEY